MTGWLVLLTAALPGCGDSKVAGCGAGVCPAGTACQVESGLCVSMVGDSVPVAVAAPRLAVRGTRTGDVLVALYDAGFGAIALRTYRADGGVGESRVGDAGVRGPVGPPLALSLTATDEPVVAWHDPSRRRLMLAQRRDGAWQAQTVDPSVDTGDGRAISLVIDAVGSSHLAYRDATGRGLRFLSVANHGCRPEGAPRCDMAEIRDGTCLPVALTVSPEAMAAAGMPSADFGQWPSIAITGENVLVASFYDASRGNLVMARCNGSELDLRVVDGELNGQDTGDVGQWSSMAVDGAGNATIAYWDRARGVLKLAASAQGELAVQIVDDGGGCGGAGYGANLVGQNATLAMLAGDGPNLGSPRIAYVDATRRAVRLARRTPLGGWSCETIAEVTVALGGVGLGLGLAVAADDTVSTIYGWWRIDPGGGPVAGIARVIHGPDGTALVTSAPPEGTR